MNRKTSLTLLETSEQTTNAPAPFRRGNTAEFAQSKHVKPQSVRKRYCMTGGYFGVRPEKLPSGRLSWPLQGNGK